MTYILQAVNKNGTCIFVSKFIHVSYNKCEGCMKILFSQLTIVSYTCVEPPHDKTNKMACAPSEDSDQPGHLPSLIRDFAVRMKKARVLSYTLSTQRRR